MAVPVEAVLFLGIIPALIIIFFGLKGYEGYYKDKIVFLTFIIGIIFGVIATIIRFYVSYYIPPFVIVYILIFALFEQLFKTIVLNIGRFQLKKETPIYGLSLGLGFGAAFTPFLIIMGSFETQSDLYIIAMIGFGSLGFILFHAATAAYIGYGIYSGNMTKHVLIAILLQIPFNLIADASRYYQTPYFPVIQVLLVIYGLILFVYIYKKIIPRILTQTKGRKRSKKST